MAAGVRGRSPARSKSRTTPNNVGTGQNTPGSKSPRVAQQRGKGMDSDGSYRRKLRNTPDHLYGKKVFEIDLRIRKTEPCFSIGDKTLFLKM